MPGAAGVQGTRQRTGCTGDRRLLCKPSESSEFFYHLGSHYPESPKMRSRAHLLPLVRSDCPAACLSGNCAAETHADIWMVHADRLACIKMERHTLA